MSHPVIGACWIVTAICNLQCPMCYSYLGKESAGIDKKRAIVDRLAQHGLKKIMFSGGDPTIDRDLVQVIRYANTKGLKTALSTNGLLLTESLMEALDCGLDELTLPIDGSTPEIHGKHRGRDGHFGVVMRLIEQVKKYRFHTDISTVVTALNRHDVLNILTFIESQSIKKWKVFQYDGLMQNEDNYRVFWISQPDFEETIATIKAHQSSVSVDFRVSSPEMMKSYVSISPTGAILMVVANRYKIIGNVFEDRSLTDILSHGEFAFDIHALRHHRDTTSRQSA